MKAFKVLLPSYILNLHALFGQTPPTPSPGQIDRDLVDKYFSMSPEELLDLPTHLTIKSGQEWLETPAAAYILTQSDLQNSGHRHIAEQLRMVPGVMVSRSTGNS